MESTITTKFIIGDNEGITLLSSLAAATIREKYGNGIPETQLENFILKRFSHAALAKEMNNLNSQFLIVYSSEEPAGFAWITSGGERPAILKGTTVARIPEFGILKKFDNDAVRKGLMDKVLRVCGMQQIVWIGGHDELLNTTHE
ncbi:N-acetyltransferase [Puia sp. P3]|uniref:N-acetyltransferase n=1 Tax=Puia sp. P3 TaxID=3423952 RepID=UPI003D66B873